MNKRNLAIYIGLGLLLATFIFIFASYDYAAYQNVMSIVGVFLLSQNIGRMARAQWPLKDTK